MHPCRIVQKHKKLKIKTNNFYFNLLLLYTSTIEKYFPGAGKEKPAVPRRKSFGFFLSFFPFGLARTKFVWNRKFPAWNRPISTILADSVCGIIWKAEAFQKLRAQKITEARRVGAPRWSSEPRLAGRANNLT